MSVPVTVCSLTGTWQGEYSGDTITHQGEPKSFSGTIAMPFTQNGASVSAALMGFTFTGTDQNGTVSLQAEVPCNHQTSLCQAGFDLALSSDCSTLSGSFYDERPRTILGTMSLSKSTLPPPPPPPPPGPPVVTAVFPSSLPYLASQCGGTFSGLTLTIQGKNLQNGSISVPSGESGFNLVGNPSVSADGTSISQQFSLATCYPFPLIDFYVQTPYGSAQEYLLVCADPPCQ